MADDPKRPLGKTQKTIRAKRAKVSTTAIRKRHEAGEDVSNDRALVRMGSANTRILTGQEDLTQWDEEELTRGQRKDKNGKFQGRPPTIVPLALHREITRRQMERAVVLMRDSVVEAVECLIGIVRGADSEDKDRIKAASMLLDRVMGTAPVKVEVEAVKSKFEEFGEAVVVWDDSLVIDAEIVDEDVKDDGYEAG